MVISLDMRAVMSGIWRQTLNTGSSTEAELVGIDDALKHVMWGMYFIQAHGFDIKKNILMQDNKWTILMVNNGRFSCTKITKHIRNRYFLIKDKVGRGEVVIQYCPTNDMWADINTKPLQGSLFYRLRTRLMGISESYHDDLEHENTHPDLLPQEVHKCGVSDDKKEILQKAGEIRDLLAMSKTITPPATRNTQTAVAALLLMKLMTKRTESSSHCRSVLEDKGFAQRTVRK